MSASAGVPPPDGPPHRTGGTVDELRTAARAWLAEAAGDAPSDYGAIVPASELEVARSWQRRVTAAGFAGLHWPLAVGGHGLTEAHTTAWIEECASARVPPFVNMVGFVLTAEALLGHGTPSQQRVHLPGILHADQLWCQLFSEPGAGSDLARLTTRAHRRGDRWVLDGQKVWCSNGSVADRGICLARTDTDAPAHRGLSMFLVDMHAPGIERRPIRQITGAADFDHVYLDGVVLPPESVVGAPGGGWGVAMSTLTHERNHVGALALGLGHRLDRLATAAHDAGPVGRDEVVGRWAAGRAAVALGRQIGRLGAPGASLMKLAVAELGATAADLTTRLAGPVAQIDGPEATGVVAARAASIAGGTTEVQKNIIAERILGLPREPGPAGT